MVANLGLFLRAVQAALQDPRFSGLVTNADFALDPTDPRFRQAEGPAKLAALVAKQKSTANGARRQNGGMPAQREAVQSKAADAAASAAGEAHITSCILQAFRSDLAKFRAHVCDLWCDVAGVPSQSAELKAMVTALKRKAAKPGPKQKQSKG